MYSVPFYGRFCVLQSLDSVIHTGMIAEKTAEEIGEVRVTLQY